MANRDAILNQDDRRIEKLSIPEWKTIDGDVMDVYIRTLKSTEIDAWEQSISDKNFEATRLTNFRARYCVKVLCDEDGKRTFTDEEAGALGEKSAAAVSRIFEAGQKLNKQDATAIDDAEGNSEAVPSGNSGTDSPLPSEEQPYES